VPYSVAASSRATGDEMSEFDTPELGRHKYTKICECCGMPVTVLAQEDDNPEYRTEIYVQCQCGEYAAFSLPVN